MLKEITLQEADKLASNDEWPVLRKAVDNRMNNKEYASGSKNTILWTLVDDGNIVGVIGYEVIQSGEIYVGPLEIHPNHRGKGYGSYMVALMKMSATMTNTSVFLYAHKDVVPFYERNGFKKGGAVEENYYEMYYDSTCVDTEEGKN